jgi:hypothetical protein
MSNQFAHRKSGASERLYLENLVEGMSFLNIEMNPRMTPVAIQGKPMPGL